jgi:hypothetical protein
MRFERYLLNEKTFSISKDVELLYNKAFKKFFDIFKKYKNDLLDLELQKELKPYSSGNYVFLETNSEILKTKEAKSAHLVNPVDIILGVFYDGSFYRPTETIKAILGKGNGVIQVSALTYGAIDILVKNKTNILRPQEMEAFINEFKPNRAKTTLSHELSHWINDSLHNFNITKTLKIARELSKPELVLLKNKDVNMTHFEIDAQIHAVKQLKKGFGKKWDKLTLIDLFNNYQSFRGIGKALIRHGDDVFKLWQKMLIKRMNREGILGKNMKRFITSSEMRYI